MYHEDQTEMLLTEEEVKKARDASYEIQRLSNNFLNVLSHELRLAKYNFRLLISYKRKLSR